MTIVRAASGARSWRAHSLVTSTVSGMGWTGVEVARLLGAGARPAELRKVMTVTSSLEEYRSLDDTQLQRHDLARLGETDVDLRGLWALSLHDDAYPEGLRRIATPPPVLFGRGDPACLSRGVAAIGTRRISKIGFAAARVAAEGAQAVGASIVSGLAHGCDGAAHEAALALGVPTVAVLACGADLVYPADHADLAARILHAGGAVVSEQLPGTHVSAQLLQARNRLITGIGWLLVVCEAPRDSRGTLGAVRTAFKEQRPVIVPRVKESWRRAEGAWLLEQLASERPDFTALGLRDDNQRCPLANAVCDDRETLVDAIRVLMHFTPVDAPVRGRSSADPA